MRTKEEIEKDLKNAKSAYDVMADMREGTSGASRGIFLDNCVRRIRELEEEMKQLPGA